MADLINSTWEITRSNGTVLNLTFLDIGILDSFCFFESENEEFNNEN